ncbi:hypothetical protein DFP72DRAFT_1175743 [Ephemerocybe angulata]|uniref:Uncharacterized protein n=1 Tax=Ephemerocybe angulata TaxID=980116 RepID=A0A8H6LXV4_9AGAR|nr:hypothetical protein DFP72DRAFT_1175743 [Tulosesus angulatus]
MLLSRFTIDIVLSVYFILRRALSALATLLMRATGGRSTGERIRFLRTRSLRVLQALVKAGVRSDLRKGISYSKQSQARIEGVCAKVVKRFPELSFGAKADALKKLIRMESREYNRESGSKGSDPSSANQENDEECEVFEDSYAEEEDADAEEEDAEEDEIDD